MNFDPMHVDYYSVRRLSPFQGVVQITQTPQTRALSVDKVNWQLQIRYDRPEPRWSSLDNIAMIRRYRRYGVWTKREGLSRLAFPPNVDVNAVQKEASVLLEALAYMPSKTCFPLADLIELWLLDAKHRLPLALLASTLGRDKHCPIRTVEWIGSFAYDREGMSSESAESLTEELRVSIERLVNTTSGTPGQAQWFERTRSGAGIGLDGVRLNPNLRNRRLSARQFPQLPLREDWPDQVETDMVHDFHAWQAPTLLTLPNLTNETRYDLEYFACRRPLTLFSLHRLYPEIIQKDRVTKALVEARIRNANARSPTA